VPASAEFAPSFACRIAGRAQTCILDHGMHPGRRPGPAGGRHATAGPAASPLPTVLMDRLPVQRESGCVWRTDEQFR